MQQGNAAPVHPIVGESISASERSSKIVRKIFTSAVGILIITVAAFHASMIALINSPDNAIKSSFESIITRYDGPLVWQQWSLFAPNPPTKNLHVVARVRLADGSVSHWLDVSQFFVDEMHQNPLTPLRPLSEGLNHAAEALADDREANRESIAREMLIRTSAMVANLYEGQGRPTALEVQIDSQSIIPGAPKLHGPAVRNVDFGWLSMPKVPPLS